MTERRVLAPRRLRHAVFVTTFVPKPEDDAAHGVFQRMRLMLEAIDAVSDRMQVVFVGGPGTAQDLTGSLQHRLVEQWGLHAEVIWMQFGADRARTGLDRLRELWSIHHQDPYRRVAGGDARQRMHDLLQTRPDLVFAHRLPAMSLLSRCGELPGRVIMDLDDIEHRKAMRLLRQGPWWWGKVRLWLQIPALMAGEIRTVRKTAVTMVCSEADRDYLGRFCGHQRTIAIPNAVPASARLTQSTLSNKTDVLFVGAYTYGPNVQAASSLISDIWPRIRAARPDARLLIVGGHPENIPEYAHPPAGVVFTGFVDELAPLYAEARVVCCPIRAAGGTRIKIIEAAVHGCAVVSTRMGAEGLAFIDEEDILLRESSEGLAEACLALISDEHRRRQLGARARDRALMLYGRRQVLDRLQAVLTQ